MRADTGTESKPLTRWLSTSRARLLLRSEARQLQGVDRHLVGYRRLQIGHWGLPAERGTLCRWVASAPDGPAGDIRFDGVHLPVASDCMDAVILPHALELSAAPHQLLREVDRVLCDRGQLVLLGFNPWGPWALSQRLRRGGYPAAGHLYRLGRVCDWLDLLDFEIVQLKRYGLGFPYLPRDGVNLERRSLWRLPAVFGQGYCVVARKRVIPLAPLPMRQRERRKMVPGAVPEATARVGNICREAA